MRWRQPRRPALSGEFIPEAKDYPKDAPKGFCFGAFTIPLFWGIAYRAWIGVAVFVVGFIPNIGPLARLAGAIYMGLKGHEMGWSQHLERGGTAASYHEREAVWRSWGVGLFLLRVLFLFLFAAAFVGMADS